MALLAELAERDASGEKAQIYAEIRRLGGVPMVALIFRHLATLPGAIEWMWAAVGPVWRQGLLQEEAWQIARRAPIEPLPPIPREALAVLGVDAAGIAEAHIVLKAYNRANPENLLTVLCLLQLLAGGTAAQALAARDWQPPTAPAPLVPMGDVAAMPPQIVQLLDLVATAGDAGGPRVVQSLYRHFFHRPQFLALAVTLIVARLRDGSIEHAAKATQTEMAAAAARLIRHMSAPPAPHPLMRAPLERFGGGVIAQMIVVGALLERALPASSG